MVAHTFEPSLPEDNIARDFPSAVKIYINGTLVAFGNYAVKASAKRSTSYTLVVISAGTDGNLTITSTPALKPM